MSINQLEELDQELETILTSFDTNYAWNYGTVKEGLRDLYEKAKRDQWNSTTQLQWDTDVDPESEIIPPAINPMAGYGPYEKLDAKETRHFRHAQVALQLSQFLHGEQGALIVASQLVGGVPWIDAKYYAGSQTMDEARHVEVFSRYLHEKLEWEWPVNDALKELLDATIKDSRWDFKYLGMQIIIEGLAMGAFGNLYLDPGGVLPLPWISIPPPSGVGEVGVPVPNDPNLLGSTVFTQALLVAILGAAPASTTGYSADTIR